jgi:hypothetical protein
MCPASKRNEVDWLAATHPHLTAISMEMERLAKERGLRTVAGLGRRWSWTEHLVGKQPRRRSAHADR